MNKSLFMVGIFLFITSAGKLYSNTEPAKIPFDKTTQAFLDKVNSQKGPALPELPIAQGRKSLIDIQSLPVHKAAADEEKVCIDSRFGPLTLTIVRPQGSKSKKLPAVIYMHGGGWVLGNEFTHDRLIRQIAHDANVAVVFVNYTPSPEAKYPVAVEQGYSAAQYIAKNGKVHNIDTSKIVIAGDSVGGNMATVITMLAKERGGPHFLCQILAYPVTDAAMDKESYKEFGAGGFWLTKKNMRWFWDLYVPENKRGLPTVSPLRASLKQLQTLPPALVIVGECDILRDEGEAYAHKLKQAGVDVIAARFLSTIHDFLMLNPLANTPATRGALTLITGTLKQVLA